MACFANRLGLGTERQAGVKDADLGNCWALPEMGQALWRGRGGGGGVRDGLSGSAKREMPSSLTASVEGTGVRVWCSAQKLAGL